MNSRSSNRDPVVPDSLEGHGQPANGGHETQVPGRWQVPRDEYQTLVIDVADSSVDYQVTQDSRVGQIAVAGQQR